MFKNQRQGNPFYILHKGDNPYCEIGNVLSVSAPRPKNPNPQYNMFPPQLEMVVDIKIKVGEDNVNFSGVAAEVAITDYPAANGEKLVLSCDLNAINTEINSMQQQSKQALDSIEYHKSVLSSCEKMLVLLNPQFAKEKERENEMASMKSEMSELRETNAKLLSMMENFLGKQQSVQTSKKTT